MVKTVGGRDNFHLIDKIILTGGSSRVRYISDKISDLAGKNKILIDENFYNSVSKGLSLYAFYKNIKTI